MRMYKIDKKRSWKNGAGPGRNLSYAAPDSTKCVRECVLFGLLRMNCSDEGVKQ